MLEIAHHALEHYSAEEGKAFARLAPDVERLLLSYWWPGNVRELLNVMRNVVVMNDGDVVTAQMVPLALAQAARTAPAEQPEPEYHLAAGSPKVAGGRALKPLWQHEQEIIEHAIATCGGNIGKAAAHLEINPSTIYRKRQGWAQSGAA